MIITLSACSHLPENTESKTYLQRVVSKVDGDIRVSAVALAASEARAKFGHALNEKGIQPVWVAVENNSSRDYMLLTLSIDADYFPVGEVVRRIGFSTGETKEELAAVLRARLLPMRVGASESISGFVFTHADEGAKAFNVDLLSAGDLRSFHFVVNVPGLPLDENLGADSPTSESTTALSNVKSLQNWLEKIPCCANSNNGLNGDPLNVVIIGEMAHFRAAMVSRGWDMTAQIALGSVWRIATAFVFGSRYRYAPVSPLFLFDRPHDVAFQKSRAIVDERNHMRLWKAPISLEGQPVWVGQVSRDVGIKFTDAHWPPVTHVIDAEVDDARFHLLQDLLYSRRATKYGYVNGPLAGSTSGALTNAEGDQYFTDGRLILVFVGPDEHRLEDIGQLNLPIRERGTHSRSEMEN